MTLDRLRDGVAELARQLTASMTSEGGERVVSLAGGAGEEQLRSRDLSRDADGEDHCSFSTWRSRSARD